jgi:hypothetical protein
VQPTAAAAANDDDDEQEEEEESLTVAVAAPSGPEEALNNLKQRYTELKGGPPTGEYSNNMGWLRDQVEELQVARR